MKIITVEVLITINGIPVRKENIGSLNTVDQTTEYPFQYTGSFRVHIPQSPKFPRDTSLH